MPPRKSDDAKAAANERVWCASLSAELHKAALAEIQRRGLTGRGAKAELVRLAIALLCGDESLAEIQIGRPPKKQAEEPDPPGRNPARRKCYRVSVTPVDHIYRLSSVSVIRRRRGGLFRCHASLSC